MHLTSDKVIHNIYITCIMPWFVVEWIEINPYHAFTWCIYFCWYAAQIAYSHMTESKVSHKVTMSVESKSLTCVCDLLLSPHSTFRSCTIYVTWWKQGNKEYANRKIAKQNCFYILITLNSKKINLFSFKWYALIASWQ